MDLYFSDIVGADANANSLWTGWHAIARQLGLRSMSAHYLALWRAEAAFQRCT